MGKEKSRPVITFETSNRRLAAESIINRSVAIVNY